MSSQSARIIPALVVGGLALVVLTWFDHAFLVGAQTDAFRSFTGGNYGELESFGTIAVAGCVMLVGVLAWWSCSLLVGIAYAVVGAYFALQMTLLTNGFLSLDNYYAGPINAAATVGAGMILAGLLAVYRWQITRHAGGAQPADAP